MRPEEFKDLILCMGSFHTAQILLKCLGNYLRGGGAENIWTESLVFGINVAQSVRGGIHYTLSLKGMLLLCEAMQRLQ